MTFEVTRDDYLRKVVADRDALLAALKAALAFGLHDECPGSEEVERHMRAVIAKAETP